MSHALVYWVTRLDTLAEILEVSVIVSSVIAIMSGIVILIAGLEFELDNTNIIKRVLKVFKPAIIILLSTALLKFFIPTTAEACLIYTLPKIANSNVIQNEVPDAINNIFKIANKCLEDKVKEYTKVKE
jgi:cytochrome b subunit of formate dehydrogenase